MDGGGPKSRRSARSTEITAAGPETALTTPEIPLDTLIPERAEAFARTLTAKARDAHNEAEIRHETVRQLAFIEQAAGVTLEARHEFTVARGRVDSVYDRVLIEYKNPNSDRDRIGPSADSPGTQLVVDQIKSRFHGMRDEHHHPLGALLGIGIDGRYLVFLRHRGGTWDVQDPVPLTRSSAERFLWALFNLGTKGKPFSPEFLAEDFGAGSPIAQNGIRVFYEAVSKTDHPKALAFFSEWKLLFSEVSGYNITDPKHSLRALAASYDIPAKGLKPAQLLFAVHSYYALFMKLLASDLIAYAHKVPRPLRRMLQASTSTKLRQEVEELEAGSIFRVLNITNFLEGDLFAWYTSVWTDSVERLVREMVERLDDYNPGTLSEDPIRSRDLLKYLYQHLFPRTVRHALGEYYTPDWLADDLLNKVGFDGDPDQRVLDPACGSGTFLVMAINRIRSRYEQDRETFGYDESALAERILRNVVGFDLNPLAVMAARTNYLIAIRDLIGHLDRVEIPVYLCDSILRPSERTDLLSGQDVGKAMDLKTSVGTFVVPTEVADSGSVLATYAYELEFCVRNKYKQDEFIIRCGDAGLSMTLTQAHRDLYERVLVLDRQKKNGVWARIIKNSFAPRFAGRFDFVVGNPPWVRWDDLPNEYRKDTELLWKRYGLFTLKGHAARLGGGKKDLSMLFVYVAADAYLKPTGRLGYVITQTLFKTRKAAEGFRRFLFFRGEQAIHIRPEAVVDMTDLHPFEAATNRTATLICDVADTPVRWPIPYEAWIYEHSGNAPSEASLPWVLEHVRRIQMGAIPMVKGALNSAWLTSPPETLPALEKVMGNNDLKARAGICTWMNSVFWLKSVIPQGRSKVRVANWWDVGRPVDERTALLEEALVYPLLRGRNVHKWKVAVPSTHIILTQDPEARAGIPEVRMKREFPLTYEYLRHFEDLLRGRPGYKKYFDPKKDPFWTVYNVGRYSVAPCRVLFKEFTNKFQSAVYIADGKPAIADTKLRFIECPTPDHAYFLSGLLNSSPAGLYLFATATSVQTADYQASDISRLNLPAFEASSDLHGEIVEHSRACHRAASQENDELLVEGEAELDGACAQLWNLSPAEVATVRSALDQFGLLARPVGVEDEDQTDNEIEEEAAVDD